MSVPRPVPAGLYDERYFEESCGGVEFFKLYGPEVLKPSMAYSYRKAGVREGMRVLDLGCGRGELLYHARRAGAFGVGTDFSPAALRTAGKVSGCPMVLCDAKSLPFKDASFDRVFFLGVMDHLHDWELEACFGEMGRVLKPGGAVLVHTCSNSLYYKRWTYGLRRALARTLAAAGLRIREPSPPRSDEDARLHVNEHSWFSMRAFFRRLGWLAVVEPRPNYKLVARRLYGEPLPEGFPLKPASALKARFYPPLLRLPPLRWFLAREFFCEARPGR